MQHNKHLIAGNWVGGEARFANDPVDGNKDWFAQGQPEHVNAAVEAAEQAFESYGAAPRGQRADFLRAIAKEIEARAEETTLTGSRETGLPGPRLEGERGRTVNQFLMFADHVEKGDYLDRHHDVALPSRKPLPRPDLRLMQFPVGPVAVFGASNFPLAFSVAGGDTASALAAGCPVVAKGHPAHPGTCEIMARSILAAIKKCSIDPGVFSLVQGSSLEAGQALVQHPLIRAVGFTGSLSGGRALFDLCASRPDPVPFFGELGSINPVFILPGAIAARRQEIAKGWAESLVMGAGQFCTNPGIAVTIAGEQGEEFIEMAGKALSGAREQTMLSQGIANAFREGVRQVSGSDGVDEIVSLPAGGRGASAHLYRVGAEAWLANPDLGKEVFGPLGLVVIVDDVSQMIRVARSLEGQLTCTMHVEDSDGDAAGKLLPVLVRKAGRVLANGFPTGVEVSDAMVHGGPYPASTNFGHTSVGTMAIRRWLRPVCFQNVPASLLPQDLIEKEDMPEKGL